MGRRVGPAAAAGAAGVSLRTTRMRLARLEVASLEGLLDRSSRPRRMRSSIDAELAERIESLRRGRRADALAPLTLAVNVGPSGSQNTIDGRRADL
jgi:hypothetical protein